LSVASAKHFNECQNISLSKIQIEGLIVEDLVANFWLEAAGRVKKVFRFNECHFSFFE